MADQKVTAVATRLKLRNWLQLKRFFNINGEIKRQLKHTPGLLRYRQKADFLRLRFFHNFHLGKILDSVDAFVRTGAHRDAMAVFDDIAVREASAFTRWDTVDSAGNYLGGSWQTAVLGCHLLKLVFQINAAHVWAVPM